MYSVGDTQGGLASKPTRMLHGNLPETAPHIRPELRVLSIVEAASVTGPLKPLLAFSSLARTGFQGWPPLTHFLMSTRRRHQGSAAEGDLLRTAA